MLLVIDAGNTSVSLGLFADARDPELLGTWRVRSDPRMTSDELAVLIRGLLGIDPAVAGAPITGVSASSTVPALLRAIRSMIERYYPDAEHVVLGPGVKSSVPLLVDNPREVGTDRVANTAGATELYGGPCVVVDFGTSTRVDVVGARGEFLGGAIAPGIDLALDALAQRTAALRRVELVAPRSVIGKNTVEALQAGVLYGFAGLVQALVGRACEIVPGATVIATGGLDEALLNECPAITARRPDLTMQGLRVIYGRETAHRASRHRRARD